MATYASVDDLHAFIDASRLAGMLGGDPTEHGSMATMLLEAGAAKMDGAFEAAGYAVPVNATGNLASLLKVYNCALAVRAVTQKLVDEPEGVKKTADEAELWLQNIIAGKAVLLGIAKTVATVISSHRGRFAFEGTGELNLPRTLFPSSGLYAGGRVDE